MNLVLQRPGGTITLPEAVLASVVVRAAESVDGAVVRRRRAIEVERTKVKIELAARRATPLPQLAGSVQRAVADALRTSAGLIVRVDVAVEELR